MTTLERINSLGLYTGWHAQELQKRAYKNSRTMEQQWLTEIKNVPIAAFNVPAKAVKVNSKFCTYEFLDGSKVKVPL